MMASSYCCTGSCESKGFLCFFWKVFAIPVSGAIYYLVVFCVELVVVMVVMVTLLALSWRPLFALCLHHATSMVELVELQAIAVFAKRFGEPRQEPLWTGRELKSDSPPSKILILSRYCYQRCKLVAWTHICDN